MSLNRAGGRRVAVRWGGILNPAQRLGSVAHRYCGPLAWPVGQQRLRRRRSNPCDGSESDVSDVLSRDPALSNLEAVLFLAKEPLNSRKLSQYANLADGTEARTLVRRLNQLYDRDGRAFRVEELAGGMQLMTRPKFASWLRRLQHVPPEIRLSAPAMETLAVVAYRQPVLRVDVEAIRGVACGEILRQLMDRDLVRVAGRSEELGRPYVYGTTKRFLRLFGLRVIQELPRFDAFRAASAGNAAADRQPDIYPTGLPNREESSQSTSTGKGDQQEEGDSQVSVTTEMDLGPHEQAAGPWAAAPGDREPVGINRAAIKSEIDDDDWDEDEYDDDDDWDDEDEEEEEEEYDENYEDEDVDDEWEEVDDDDGDDGDDGDEEEDYDYDESEDDEEFDDEDYDDDDDDDDDDDWEEEEDEEE